MWVGGLEKGHTNEIGQIFDLVGLERGFVVLEIKEREEAVD